MDAGYVTQMSITTIASRPLRRVRAPQLLSLLRTFDDALADLDDAGDDAPSPSTEAAPRAA
jgi:hypothetical protein